MNDPRQFQSCVSVQSISKAFGKVQVLEQVSFSLARGQVLAVLGISGAGKTTLLRVLAGLEKGDSGEVLLDGRRAEHFPPQARGVVYLYQEPLLFPHLDVFENIAFGLRLRGHGKAAITREVEALLDELMLGGFARRRPQTLSGGQCQRVAFARALVVKPSLLLLDEPFGKLDAETRAAMQTLFKDVVRRHAIGAVFVTHDVQEALTVGDAFARLDAGRLLAYADLAAFCADTRNGIERQAAFWQAMAARITP